MFGIYAVGRERSVTGPVLFESVPDITVKVVVSAEQQSAAGRESDCRDAADDVVVRVHRDLLIRAHIKHATRRVVRASRERQCVRKILQQTRPYCRQSIPRIVSTHSVQTRFFHLVWQQTPVRRIT